ncbi:MAG: extensin family protein [Alphaproteobacteria bacterium]|nr:extensin family protein [Alphaproteobacteria bacterium]MBV9373152.1 extensin family protein [Alphaproteobacteria bacterium]MBV9900241.1 extensin family protein [Alphaproteobacteria bacterium]
MRGRGVVVALLLVAGCIPSGRDKPPPKAPPVSIEPDKQVLQCLGALGREGVRFKPLPDRYFANGCTAVGAVQLLDIGTPVTNLGAMTCPVARGFAGWVREAVQPAATAWLGSPVVRIESLGTYSCRPVNNQAGARLSEHGRANAVDVGAFVLADGRRITVASGWNGGDEDVRRFLRAVHDAGCRRFQVGLGPDANAFHRDHLHFDMGRGPYCR